MEEPQEEVKVIYSSYTPAQARANKKWAEKNKEKVQQYGRTYGKSYYERNKELVKKKNLERYYKKKEEKQKQMVQKI